MTIYWAAQEEARELAEFFVRHVRPDPNYISHSEIQHGRALDENRWAANLDEVVLAEFLAKTPKDGHLLADGGLVAARHSSHLMAVAVVAFRAEGGAPYAILEDLVVDPSQRRKEIGKRVLEWIERQAVDRGMSRLFLESGLHNEEAHAFFRREGFSACSVIMMKALNG
jgi:GNAT superfamily N-acetyltransferase